MPLPKSPIRKEYVPGDCVFASFTTGCGCVCRGVCVLAISHFAYELCLIAKPDLTCAIVNSTLTYNNEVNFPLLIEIS